MASTHTGVTLINHQTGDGKVNVQSAAGRGRGRGRGGGIIIKNRQHGHGNVNFQSGGSMIQTSSPLSTLPIYSSSVPSAPSATSSDASTVQTSSASSASATPVVTRVNVSTGTGNQSIQQIGDVDIVFS